MFKVSESNALASLSVCLDKHLGSHKGFDLRWKLSAQHSWEATWLVCEKDTYLEMCM